MLARSIVQPCGKEMPNFIVTADTPSCMRTCSWRSIAGTGGASSQIRGIPRLESPAARLAPERGGMPGPPRLVPRSLDPRQALCKYARAPLAVPASGYRMIATGRIRQQRIAKGSDDMDERERHQALAAFLRTRRARLRPAAVGLPPRRPGRPPGLRREEVAELAHIGFSCDAVLEQGHDVHPSRHLLQS